jgi:hypothetical protein
MKKTVEGKNKLLKNKIVMALGYSNPSLGNSEQLGLEDVVRVACEVLESNGRASFMKGTQPK